ncbi:MAG: hypothetical protein LBQ58_08040 [Synergistaceae bacterium]|jgi:hypothetical protein|nr:hypothetical protein [Synergistaceae bacterium]
MKNMKRSGLLLISVLCLVFCGASVAFSHPPKEISLLWKPEGVLSVKVAHLVDNPEKHYVFRIIVYVNDKITAEREYKSQQSAEALTDSFSLGALPSGTNIKVEARCIIMGSAVSSIVVP